MFAESGQDFALGLMCGMIVSGIIVCVFLIGWKARENIYLARKRDLLRQMGESGKGKGVHSGRFAKGHPFHPKRSKNDEVN